MWPNVVMNLLVSTGMQVLKWWLWGTTVVQARGLFDMGSTGTHYSG